MTSSASSFVQQWLQTNSVQYTQIQHMYGTELKTIQIKQIENRKKLVDLEVKKAQNQKDIENMLLDIEEVEAKLKAAQAQQEKSQIQLEQQIELVKQSQAKHEEKNHEIREAEIEAAVLQEELHQLQQSTQYAVNQIANYVTEAQNQKEMQLLQVEEKELQNGLAESVQDIRKLESEIKDLKDKIEEDSNQINDNKNVILQTEDTINHKENNIYITNFIIQLLDQWEIDSTKIQTQAQIEELQSQLAEYKDYSITHTGRFARRTQHVSRQDERDQLQRQIDSCKQEINQLQERYQQHTSNIQNLRSNMEKENEEILRLKCDNNELRNKKQQLESTVQRNSNLLQEKEQVLVAEEKNKAKLQSKIKGNTIRQQTLMLDCRGLQKLTYELNSQQSEVKSKISTIYTNIKQLNDMLTQAKLNKQKEEQTLNSLTYQMHISKEKTLDAERDVKLENARLFNAKNEAKNIETEIRKVTEEFNSMEQLNESTLASRDKAFKELEECKTAALNLQTSLTNLPPHKIN